MANLWKCIVNGQEYGPLTDRELRNLAKGGTLKPTDMVVRDGTRNWVPADKVKGLFVVPVAEEVREESAQHQPAGVIAAQQLAAAHRPTPLLGTRKPAKAQAKGGTVPWFKWEVLVGWLINVLAWIIFLATMHHGLEIIGGVACLIAAFLGYKGRSSSLLVFSLIDAVWMFAWGFGVFGDYGGLFGQFGSAAPGGGEGVGAMFSGIFVTSISPETAKKQFIDTAHRMGGTDPVFAALVIDLAKNEDGIPAIGWKYCDEKILLETTPETIAAYYTWRDAVIRSKK